MARIALVVILSMLAMTASADNYYPKSLYTLVPDNAFKYLPIVKQEQEKIWPDLITPAYLGALIEKESCYTLTSKKCWNPDSRLLTSREEGAGFFQLTRAYTSSGSVRFDTLTNLRDKYSDYLKELSWDNVYLRPDLQITAGILLVKENYAGLYNVKDKEQRLLFTDASYNQGIGNTFKQMRLCGLQKGCNPQIWFNNVALACTTNRVIYGNRTACQINRDHVYDIFNVRLKKYKDIWPDIK